MRRLRGLSGAFILLAAISGGCSPPSNDEVAPDFELKDVDGKDVSLSDFRGKVVLINFWAVGCMPCRMELPHLKTLYDAYNGNGFTVLAVNAWDEPPEVVKEFAKQLKIPFTVLVSGEKVFKELYQGGGIPMGVLIDRNGNVVFRHIGIAKDRMEALDRKVKQLMG